VRGGAWVFGLRVASRLLRLARSIVLARLLEPKDFGVFGIGLLAAAAIETLTRTGFQAALVQKRKGTEKYLDTAWTIEVFRGLFLAAIGIIFARPIANFFNAPAAMRILQAVAISMAVRGFVNIGVVYFRKELQFHKTFLLEATSAVADFVVAVAFGVIFHSVWALVFGLLARNLIYVCISYLVHPYRPRLRFNLEQFRELFRFGKWVLASSVLIFLSNHADNAITGKLLGMTALGLYQMAFRLSNPMATEITHLISQVTFPAYSKLQHNRPRLRKAYFEVLDATCSICVPLAALIILFSPDLVPLVLGSKWEPLIRPLQILSVSGLIRSIIATGGPLYWAAGLPRLNFWVNFVRVSAMAIGIYPLTMALGTSGTALSVVIALLVATPVWGFACTRLLKVHLKDILRPLLIPVTGVVLMSLYVAVGQWAFRPLTCMGIIALGFGAIAGYLLFQVTVTRMVASKEPTSWRAAILKNLGVEICK